jgi:hypothetical protein
MWHGCDRDTVENWLRDRAGIDVTGWCSVGGFCGVMITAMMERTVILSRHLSFVVAIPFLFPLRDGRWFLWFRAEDTDDPRCAWVLVRADAMPPPCEGCARTEATRRARMN